jgi:hypothetical protein
MPDKLVPMSEVVKQWLSLMIILSLFARLSIWFIVANASHIIRRIIHLAIIIGSRVRHDLADLLGDFHIKQHQRIDLERIEKRQQLLLIDLRDHDYAVLRLLLFNAWFSVLLLPQKGCIKEPLRFGLGWKLAKANFQKRIERNTLVALLF